MADFLDQVPSTESKRCQRAFLVGIQTHEMASGEAGSMPVSSSSSPGVM
jgi:GTP-binding protein HflX